MKGYEISFSPTGGTQRAAGILAERLLGEERRVQRCSGFPL